MTHTIFTAQHFAWESKPALYCQMAALLPSWRANSTAPTHSVEVAMDSESATTTASCGALDVGRTSKWRLQGRRPCAPVVNKAQGTSLPERQPKRYSPLKRVCRRIKTVTVTEDWERRDRIHRNTERGKGERGITEQARSISSKIPLNSYIHLLLQIFGL